MVLAPKFPTAPISGPNDADPPKMGPYATDLERTLSTLDLGDFDAAAAGLARGMARAMDGCYGDARELARIAPKYAAALKALRATRESSGQSVVTGGEVGTMKLTAY